MCVSIIVFNNIYISFTNANIIFICCINANIHVIIICSIIVNSDIVIAGNINTNSNDNNICHNMVHSNTFGIYNINIIFISNGIICNIADSVTLINLI